MRRVAVWHEPAGTWGAPVTVLDALRAGYAVTITRTFLGDGGSSMRAEWEAPPTVRGREIDSCTIDEA